MHTLWNQFFSQQGEPQTQGTEPSNYIVPLSHYGLLTTTGADAAKLIQGQSSCDIRKVSDKNAQYGSFNNPKGRCFANFLIKQNSTDDYLLRMQGDIIDSTQQTLAKYLAFFKAEQTSSQDYLLFGLKGKQAAINLETIFGKPPQQNLSGCLVDGNHLTCIDPASHLYECWLKVEAIESLWPQLKNQLTWADKSYWQQDLIKLGLAELTSNTVDLFIPQMLNYQITGAINFTKGCFTGQEIIARMQYKGKVKRRLYRVDLSSSATINAGAELFIKDKAQAIGNVVNTGPKQQYEADAPQTIEALAVLTHEASKERQLFLADGSPVSINLLELPYPLDNETA